MRIAITCIVPRGYFRGPYQGEVGKGRVKSFQHLFITKSVLFLPATRAEAVADIINLAILIHEAGKICSVSHSKMLYNSVYFLIKFVIDSKIFIHQ